VITLYEETLPSTHCHCKEITIYIVLIVFWWLTWFCIITLVKDAKKLKIKFCHMCWRLYHKLTQTQFLIQSPHW
jgi:hypothetical protein